MPSPVKAAALELGLPVTDRVDDVLDADVPLGVVVAFGRLIKPHVLEAVPMVNLHFSLLPRWRGAAPVERAILAGDERTGRRPHGRRGGPRHRRHLPAHRGADRARRHARGAAGAPGRGGHPAPRGGAARGHRRADAAGRRADLRRQAHGRGSPPRLERPGRRRPPPGAARRRLDHPPRQAPQGVAHAACPRRATAHASRAADGEVELVEVQPEGKGRMDAKAWANGARWHPGDPLGS